MLFRSVSISFNDLGFLVARLFLIGSPTFVMQCSIISSSAKLITEILLISFSSSISIFALKLLNFDLVLSKNIFGFLILFVFNISFKIVTDVDLSAKLPTRFSFKENC